MLQKINQNCLGVVTRASGSTITGPSSFLDWHLPCNIHSPIEGSGANLTGYKSRANWHISAKTHSLFSQMMRPSGQVYYTWDDVKDTKSKSSSCVYSYLISYHSNQRSLPSSVLDLRVRPATISYLPGSVLESLPLLSHQCRSLVPSRIWSLLFPPHSLNMFAHCLFKIGGGLCTVFDSSTTTDYPNSHTLTLVIIVFSLIIIICRSP